MKWFNKHLHLTWLIYMIVSIFILGIVLGLFFDYRTAGRIGGLMWMTVIPFPINLWMLKQKGRSWAWAIFTFWALGWFPLLVGNKNDSLHSRPTLQS